MFWSKKKSIIEQIREREAKEKEWEDIPIVGARPPEQRAEIEAKSIESANEMELEEPRKERDKEEKAEDGLKLVINTAKLECKLCSNPQGLMKVNYDTPTIQGKKTATVKEKSPQSLVFTGNCNKSPQSSSPCASVMQLGEWKDVGTSKSQDERVLLQKSTIKCNYGSIDIKITDSGQINEPESILTIGAPVPKNEENKKCYCNRDFTVDEMIGIIYNLRDKQKMVSKRDVFFNMGGESISSLKISTGKLTDAENKYKVKLFTDEMNKMFKKFEINSCKRKIHFIGQMYLETIYFRYTYESRIEVPKNYKGGVAFQGRGMKQITHDFNYLSYYDYVNDTRYYKIYQEYAKKDSNGNLAEGVGETVTSSKAAREKGLNEEFYNNLKIFAKYLSQDLFHSFNSAGWYSTIRQRKTLDAMDEGFSDKIVAKVTKAINGGDNGLPERINFTNWTKEFFKYDTKCINN